VSGVSRVSSGHLLKRAYSCVHPTIPCPCTSHTMTGDA
jgi:hypothetical protein